MTTPTAPPLRIGTAGLSLPAALFGAVFGLMLLLSAVAGRRPVAALLGIVVWAGLRWAWERRAPVVLEPTQLVVQRAERSLAVPLRAVIDVRARWSALSALRLDVVVRFDPEVAVGAPRALRLAPAALVELGTPPTVAERIRAAAAACGARVRGA